MKAQLEPGLKLTKTLLPCLRSAFTRGAFVDAADNRGRAFLFERLENPAVFIEVIHTAPDKIRGNHVHQNCVETLNVVSGKLVFYQLCDCPEKHVLEQVMKSGDTVVTQKGVPHALQTLEETEIVVFFDKDPRKDRDRVQILAF